MYVDKEPENIIRRGKKHLHQTIKQSIKIDIYLTARQ